MCDGATGELEIGVGEGGDAGDAVDAVDVGDQALDCEVPGWGCQGGEADEGEGDVPGVDWRWGGTCGEEF